MGQLWHIEKRNVNPSRWWLHPGETRGRRNRNLIQNLNQLALPSGQDQRFHKSQQSVAGIHWTVTFLRGWLVVVRVVPAQNAVPRGHQQRNLSSYTVNSLFLSTASNQMSYFKCNKARASVLLCPASLLGCPTVDGMPHQKEKQGPGMNALILSLLCTQALPAYHWKLGTGSPVLEALVWFRVPSTEGLEVKRPSSGA